MPVDPEQTERRVEMFKRACREAGLRLTHQRLTIFRELGRSQEHPSAETIFERVREELLTISRDTVYRTLRMLEEEGLLDTVGVLHERLRFDPNTEPHHHYICTRCGEVWDFYSDELDAFEPPEEVRNWGRIEGMQAEVRGTCAECLERGESDAG